MIQIFIISRYRKQEGFLNLAILPKIRFFTCFLSLLLVLISTVSATEDVKKFDSIAKEIEDNAFSYAEKSGKLIAELQSIDDKYPDNSYFSIQTLYWEARVNYLQSISDSTLLLQCIQYKKSLNEGKSYFEKALLHHTLSLCYMVEGNYTEAFSMALKSLEQFQRVKDTAFIIKTLNILGNICFKTENRKMATNYYEQALALTKPPQREYYSILMNLYTNLAYMKEHEEKAIDSLIVFVPRFENGPDKGLYAGICFNLSSILYGKGDEKGGYHYYCLSKECIEKYKIDNQVMKIGLYSFMATENTLQKSTNRRFNIFIRRKK